MRPGLAVLGPLSVRISTDSICIGAVGLKASDRCGLVAMTCGAVVASKRDSMRGGAGRPMTAAPRRCVRPSPTIWRSIASILSLTSSPSGRVP